MVRAKFSTALCSCLFLTGNSTIAAIEGMAECGIGAPRRQIEVRALTRTQVSSTRQDLFGRRISEQIRSLRNGA
jgi:hypothetical protein